MDFDEAYSVATIGQMPSQYAPQCSAPTCFIGSYAPITPPGQMGPYWVNTYFLQPNRKKEIAGPATFTASMWGSCSK